VGTGGLAGGGEDALPENGDEVLLAVVGLQGVQEVGGGDLVPRRGGADGEDPAADGHQHRGEGEPGILVPARATQVLQDLGDVPVAAADGVGGGGGHALGEHQVLLGGSAGPGVADLQHGAEGGRIDQSGPEQGCQGQGDGGGVAAGHRDLPRAA